MPYGVILRSSAAAAGAVPEAAPLTSVGETLLSLRADLTLLLGNRSDATNDRLNGWINKAYRDMASSLELPEVEASYAFNTVSGQPFYTMPQAVAWADNAAIADALTYPSGGRPLSKSGLDTYRRQAEATGDVRLWFQYGTVWVLWPTPTGIYTVSFDVRIRPDLLTADTHSPIFKPEWHEGLLLLARAKALRDLLDYKAAAVARNDYVTFVRDRIDIKAARTQGTHTGLRPARAASDLYKPTLVPLAQDES
jgi:hypothetical protein